MLIKYYQLFFSYKGAWEKSNNRQTVVYWSGNLINEGMGLKRKLERRVHDVDYTEGN